MISPFKFVLIVCLPLLLLNYAGERLASYFADARKLIFKNGYFKIVIFTDQHYGENAWDTWGPEQDVSSTRVMNIVLDIEKPDLVIYLGDQLTSNNIMNTNASLYLKRVTQPTRLRNIPYALVFGNHDSAPFEWDETWFGPSGIPKPYSIPSGLSYGGGRFESRRQLVSTLGVTTRHDLLMVDKSSGLSLTQAGPSYLWPSAGNYHVPLYARNNSSPAVHFYFLDTGGGMWPQIVSYSQVQWLNETTKIVNPHNSPEIIFQHIPLSAINDVLPPTTPYDGGDIPKPCLGDLNSDGLGDTVVADNGLTAFLTERTSFKAMFSGHNHGNDWCCPAKNPMKMWLCYGRHSGYGGYGTWDRGAKVLLLSESNLSIDTWVRFENGSRAYHGLLTNL